MTATRIQICDAIVTQLASALTGTPVTRVISPVLDPDAFAAPKVQVLPHGIAMGSRRRSANDADLYRDISICVIVYAPKPDAAVLATASNLADQIFDLFAIGSLRTFAVSDAEFDTIDMIEPYNEQLMRETSLYRSHLMVTYRITS